MIYSSDISQHNTLVIFIHQKSGVVLKIHGTQQMYQKKNKKQNYNPFTIEKDVHCHLTLSYNGYQNSTTKQSPFPKSNKQTNHQKKQNENATKQKWKTKAQS